MASNEDENENGQQDNETYLVQFPMTVQDSSHQVYYQGVNQNIYVILLTHLLNYWFHFLWCCPYRGVWPTTQ